MNKYEVTSAIAKKTGFTKTDVLAVVNAFMDVILETVADGGSINMYGVFNIDHRIRPGHHAYIFKDKETKWVEPYEYISCRPGIWLKECINGIPDNYYKMMNKERPEEVFDDDDDFEDE